MSWLRRRGDPALRRGAPGSTDELLALVHSGLSSPCPLPYSAAHMSVENRIVKVQKRNRALVRFDEARIWKAILRAAQSIGGFEQDFLPEINDKLFQAHGSDEK